MGREYSEAEVRKMLEASVSLVREDDHLGSAFGHGAANEFAREDSARKILSNHLPHYRQAVPQEFLDVVDASKIEDRCKSAIRQVRGAGYEFK